ncbi:MAG TPA: PEP-CTERM sorting domain-containing protein, partial [Humisphaera sp.]
MRRMMFPAAAIAAAVVSSAAPARATVIATDNFESYAPGSQLAGQSGGTGFNAPYVSDNPPAAVAGGGGLSYANGAVSIGGGSVALQLVPATTGAVSNAGGAADNGTLARTFSNQTDPIYFRFLLRTNNTGGNEFLQVGLSNQAAAEPNASVGVAGATADVFNYFVRIPGGTGNQVVSSTLFAPNTTDLVVGKVSKTAGSTNYNRIDLYVNPSTGTEPGTATATRTGDSGQSGFTTFNFRTARFQPGDVYTIDGLVLGTTYADVVPVPEPASAALAAAGAGLLLLRRRRRAR